MCFSYAAFQDLTPRNLALRPLVSVDRVIGPRKSRFVDRMVWVIPIRKYDHTQTYT